MKNLCCELSFRYNPNKAEGYDDGPRRNRTTNTRIRRELGH